MSIDTDYFHFKKKIIELHENVCCYKKEVAGLRYILVAEEDTSEYNCMSSCVYATDSEPGSRYCFQPGGFPVQCVNADG